MGIRGKTISYTLYKRKQRISYEENLKTQIEKFEVGNTDLDELENLKRQLENKRQEKIEGVIIRSKTKWSEEGKKPTKYFLSLENKHVTNTIIHRVEKDNGDIRSV